MATYKSDQELGSNTGPREVHVEIGLELGILSPSTNILRRAACLKFCNLESYEVDSQGIAKLHIPSNVERYILALSNQKKMKKLVENHR